MLGQITTIPFSQLVVVYYDSSTIIQFTRRGSNLCMMIAYLSWMVYISIVLNEKAKLVEFPTLAG